MPAIASKSISNADRPNQSDEAPGEVVNLKEKKRLFVEELAKRHVSSPLSYEDFRKAAVPVFRFWEDAAYRRLYGTFKRERILEEMSTLYPDSPCSYGEFRAAAVSEQWSESVARKSYTAFKSRMRSQWKTPRSAGFERPRVYAPYKDILQVVSEVTGYQADEVIQYLIAHYVTLVLTQQINLVESIVSAGTVTVEEIALAKRLLRPMDLSDDPRIKSLDHQRITKRRRLKALGNVFGV